MQCIKHMKRHWKRIAAAVLSAVMLLSILPFSAFAASTQYLYRVVGVGNKFTISGNYGGRFTAGKVGQFDDILIGPNRSSTRESYCLQFMVPSGQNEGSDMSRNEVGADSYGELSRDEKRLINYAISFGYNDNTRNNPAWAYASNPQGARWATQGLIWSIAEGVFNTANEAALVRDYAKSGIAGISDIYYSIKNKILNFDKRPSYAGGIPSQSPTHNLYYNSANGKYEATLTDSNGVSNRWNFKMDGVTFTKVNASTLKVSTSRTDVENLVVSADKTIETSGETGVVSGNLRYFTNKDHYQAVCLFDKGTPDPVHAYFKLKIATGNIIINKSAEDGQSSNKQFRITGNGIDRTVTTGADGSILSTGLNPGTYTITEVNTPGKYVQPATQTVTIQAGQTSTVTFSNKLKKFTVEGIKKDGETTTAQGNASLDGAVYGLYRGNTLVERMTTSNGGKFSSGTYTCGDNWTIKEISPSPGYNLDTTVYPVGAEPGNFTVEYNTVSKAVNEQVKKGKAKLYKFTDEHDPGAAGGGDQIKKPEAGAQFQLWLASAGSYANAKPTERCILTTDANGQAETPLLPFGEYVGHQTKGQAGTAFVDDFRFAIQEQDQTLHYYIENPQIKSSIRIFKVDAETGERIPLAGAGFKVRDMQTHQFIVQHVPYPSDEWIDTFYTNADGWLMMPEMLPIGDYQAIEVMAPYGYVLDSTPVDFHVDGLGTPVTVTKYDKAQKGTIGVLKTGEIFSSVSQTGEGDEAVYQPVYASGILSGAAYKVYADEDIITPDGTLRAAKGTLVDTLTTGTKDKTVPLYLGKYKIVETKAPYGYVLNSEPQYITLTYAGQYVEVTQASTSFTNERQKLKLDLIKALEEDELFELSHLDAYRNIRFGLYANEEIRANDGTVIPKDGLLEIVGLSPQLQASFRSDLPFGQYYVQEIATDNHYILNGEKYLITFSYQDQLTQTIHITVNDGRSITNTLKRGSVMGLKVDQDGFTLAGALLGLFRANETEFTEDNALLTCLSNEIGVFGFFEIPYGDYLIAEIAPPEGFLLTDTVVPVSITEDGQSIDVEIENQIITGSVQTLKTDADYPELHLSGAEFTVYRDVDNNQEYDPEIDIKVDTLIEGTGEAQGSYLLTGLVYGGYFLKETQAPEGYLLDDTAYFFEIEEDGEVVNIETQAGQGFVNTAQSGSLKITKMADDGVIENIPFRVTGETVTGVPYEEIFYTDANGEIYLENLRIGSYTVEELNGDGTKYILPPKQTVEIKCGKLSGLTFHNALIPVIPSPPTGDTALPAFICLAVTAGGLICLLRKKQHSK